MATQEQISAVVDAVIKAFSADPKLWEAFLIRSRLTTDLAKIESNLRNAQAEADKQASANVVIVSALATEKAAKIAEIDAL